MILIGLTGKKRSGKNSVADLLCKQLAPLHCEQMAFGDDVKETCARMIRAVDPRFITAPLPEVRRYMEANKDIFRPLYQWVGTEYGRTIFGEDVWIRKLLQKIINLGAVNGVVIVTDVRFVNEAQMIKDAGGVLIRVRRPGLESTDLHQSEIDMDNYYGIDLVISNDGPLATLHLVTANIAEQIKKTFYTQTHITQHD